MLCFSFFACLCVLCVFSLRSLPLNSLAREAGRCYRSNNYARAAKSASRIRIASPEAEDASGTGLHPPGVPTDCELIGEAQFLHTSPFCPLKNPTEPQISQASNTATTLPSGF